MPYFISSFTSIITAICLVDKGQKQNTNFLIIKLHYFLRPHPENVISICTKDNYY